MYIFYNICFMYAINADFHRRYCYPSCTFLCLLVGWFVRSLVCSLACSFVSSHPPAAISNRLVAGLGVR